MNTIGTSVTSGVIGSVKGLWELGQTNEWQKEDEKTVITTCSAKTVKWSNVSPKSMAARRPHGRNLYNSIEAYVRDQGTGLLNHIQFTVNHAWLVAQARCVVHPSIVENLSDEQLIRQISAAARDASHTLQVVPGEIPIEAPAESGVDSGNSSASTVSQSSMEARRPNGQNLFVSIEAFVRAQTSCLPILQQTGNHAWLVAPARGVVHPSIVEDLSDEQLIRQISAAVRDASHTLQVVPGEIPIIAGAGSGVDSGISSAINVSQSSMAARRPNGQKLYHSIEAFVRAQGSCFSIFLQFTWNHACLVALARSKIRARIVKDLSEKRPRVTH
jgi:hypothetical protein